MGRFTYEASTASLGYSVQVTGVPAADVHAVTLTRGGTDRPGATLVHLSGLGRGTAQGTATLTESEQNALASGTLVLTVYTKAQPHGAARAPLPAMKD